MGLRNVPTSRPSLIDIGVVPYPGCYKKARKSLYELFSQWVKVKSAFDAQVRPQTIQIPAPEVLASVEPTIEQSPSPNLVIEAANLTDLIVNSLGLTDKTAKDEWFTAMTRLLDGNPLDKVTKVANFALVNFKSMLKMDGAGGFEASQCRP